MDRNNKEVGWLEDVPSEDCFPLTVLLRDLGCSPRSTVWKQGVVEGPQSLRATTVGYRVRLLPEDVVVDHVPALRLRLRFPPGMELDAYLGYEIGWVRGRVHSEGEPDGIGYQPPTPRARTKEVFDVKDFEYKRPRELPFPIDPWVKVPVAFDDQVQPHWIPSYYLRTV